MTKPTILLTLCLLLLAGRASAQFEVKLSPVALLFGAAAVSVEMGLSPSFGLDLDGIIADGGGGVNLSGKYYFNPQMGLDRFHVGAFLGTLGDAPGVGFLAGVKLLSRHNVLFEIGLGAGRSFDGGAVGYGKLHLGYRFPRRA